MHRFPTALCGLVVLAVVALQAPAQTFPSKPVTLVVPYAPGGQTDQLARSLSQPLAQRLGQPVVVDNKPGGAGAIGTSFVLKSPPDGHSLLLLTASTVQQPPANLPTVNFREATLIASIGQTPYVLVVNSSSPYRTVQDLAKATKDLTFGSAGNASVSSYNARTFQSNVSSKILVVPYRGSEVLADLLGGRFDAGFFFYPSVEQHINSGKLRALAQTGPTRTAFLKDTPTMAEAGVKGVYLEEWYAIVGPPKLDQTIVAKISSSGAHALKEDGYEKKLAQLGVQPLRVDQRRFEVMVEQRLTHSIGGGGGEQCATNQCWCKTKRECQDSPCTNCGS